MATKRTLLFCLLLAVSLTGCAGARTTGKVVATPFAFTRDMVDVPLVTLTNLCEVGAQWSKPSAFRPYAGVGLSNSGPTAGIGLNLTWAVMKGLSYAFGAVDYIVCRSLYPNYPKGVSPWRQPDQPWGDLYFPNTDALWPLEEGAAAH